MSVRGSTKGSLEVENLKYEKQQKRCNIVPVRHPGDPMSSSLYRITSKVLSQYFLGTEGRTVENRGTDLASETPFDSRR